MREQVRNETRTQARPAMDQPTFSRIGDWLHIESDGTITVFTGKVEVGQGIRTSLAQVVAEELRVPAESIRMVMADTETTPFDMGTFGSRTTPTMAVQLRKVAASTRELLLDLASSQWKVERDELRVVDGRVVSAASEFSAGFGELTRGRRLDEPYDEEAPVTPATEWTVAGASVSRLEGRAKVTGEHRYTPDVILPGMLAGKVLRPPAINAQLVSLDTTRAEAMPGVTVVHDGDFIGVTAQDIRTATRAIEAIRAEWGPGEQISNNRIFDYLRGHLAEPSELGRFGSPPGAEIGSLDAGRAEADLTMEATYTIAYIAHTPMEPRAAVAEWSGEKLTVWTGTQRPFGVRGELAEAFQIPEDQVRVITPDTGAGFGGKHTGEAAVEAARLARASGRPVRLIWTREEEFTYAYFRPAGVIDVASGVRSDGTLTSWEFHNYNSGPSGIQTPYAVPNQRAEHHPALSPLRQGAYRALASTANHFARETHMDELAHALKLDPLAFRLRNLQDDRVRAVLETAASRFGWSGVSRTPDTGYGLACGTEKGSYVATCAEVKVDRTNGQIHVVRVVQAFECGAILNPDNLRNQIEGAIIQGLGGALFEEIRFEHGKILSDRFSRYRVPRFKDMPKIDVVLLDRKDLPSAGAGETPIVGIAPAVGNALFDATGKRLRSMPLAPEAAWIS